MAYNEDLKIEEETKEPLRSSFKLEDESNAFITEAMNKESNNPSAKED